MLRHSHTVALAALAVWAAAPINAHAQQSSIVATATVVGRPLSLQSVTGTEHAGMLRVRIDGCGSGAVTVHGVTTDHRTVRVAKHEILARDDCQYRELLLPLSHAESAQFTEFQVSLSHQDALLAASISQIVVSAAATRPISRATLGH